MSCPRRRGELAAYLLGALGESERARVREHLAGCAECRAEFDELAPLPGLLSRVSVDELTRDAVSPDPGFTDRTIAAAAGRQRHIRRRLAGAAAAVVVAAGATAIGVTASTRSPAIATMRAANPATGVHGEVQLISRAVGTQLDVTVTGLATHQWCVMVVVGRDGTRQTAASWQATYTGSASIQGTTAIPESQVSAVVVETPSGSPLLTFSA